MVDTIGAHVRTYHGSQGTTGIIVCEDAPSPLDGSRRMLVRWTLADGRTRESRWSPDVLVAADAPRENDPDYVLLGRSQSTGKYAYLTANGVIHTETDPVMFGILFDKKLLGAILGL